MSIQSSINSMVSSSTHAIMAVRGYKAMQARMANQHDQTERAPAAVPTQAASLPSVQAQAAARARQSAQNAIEAKRDQRRHFNDYLSKYSILNPAEQAKIAAKFTPGERRGIMNRTDKEAMHV